MANPPFSNQQRQAVQQQNAAIAAQPRAPDPFIGGRQPLERRKLIAALLDVDSPPPYVWELLVLPPEDTTAYFRAQRWPQQKIIVSVDNPPAQDDERAAIMQVIIGIWNAPIVPLPQLQRKIAATIVQVSSASGDLLSLGVGTGAFVGQSGSQADWSATSLGTAAFVGVASNTADWLSTATGTAQWLGAALDTGAWSSAGIAAAIWNEASFATGAWSATGVATATFVGSQPAASAGDILSSGVSLFTAEGASTVSGDILSTGVATVRFSGAASGARAANLDGWKVRALQDEKRRRKDEDEIMAIAKAVIPLLQSGIRQPTRISL